MAIRTKKIEPEVLYRAVEPTSFVDEEGVPRTLTRQTVLLGKHPWVQALPHLWGREGDPRRPGTRTCGRR